MKKVLCLMLVITAIFALCVPVCALDVKDSEADYYDHEETGVTIPYRLVVPEIYDEKYVFPLVVFFHGAGERGFENERQLDNCVQQIANKMPKALILVPQCSHGNQWVDTPWGDGCYSVDEVPESDEMMAVMDLIEEIKQQYSIDEDMVYAAGISMGGFAVWDAMVRHNDVFAAGVAVCGAGDPSKAEVLKDTPMFVYHGTDDDTVPFSGSEEMVAAIEAAGGTKVQFVEFDGVGHGIWGQVFNLGDMYKQLQRCKLSDRYVAEPEPDPVQEGLDIPAYVIWAAAGVVVVAAVIVLVVILKKKRKPAAE